MAKWIKGFDDNGTRYSCVDDLIDFFMDGPEDLNRDDVIKNLRNIRNTPLEPQKRKRYVR
jgi:hypothetical protein